MRHVATSSEITVIQEWKCPDCNTVNKEEYSGDPYRCMAESPIDSSCTINCEEFFTLSFYSADYVEELNEEGP